MLAEFRAEAARERNELRDDQRARAPNEPNTKPTPTVPSGTASARPPLRSQGRRRKPRNGTATRQVADQQATEQDRPAGQACAAGLSNAYCEVALRRGCYLGGSERAYPSASGALMHVRRPPHLRLCRLLPALVSLLFLPLLVLLPIFLLLIGTCASVFTVFR